MFCDQTGVKKRRGADVSVEEEHVGFPAVTIGRAARRRGGEPAAVDIIAPQLSVEGVVVPCVNIAHANGRIFDAAGPAGTDQRIERVIGSRIGLDGSPADGIHPVVHAVFHIPLHRGENVAFRIKFERFWIARAH